MIRDHVDHIKTYAGISERFQIAVDFLTSTPLEVLPVGTVEIDDRNVFAVVTEKNLAEVPTSWETHKRYADIQLVIGGAERIGYAPVSKADNSSGYDNEKDLELYTDIDGQICTLTKGEFMIFFPQDIHLPNIPADSAVSTKKVIVKVLLSHE